MHDKFLSFLEEVRKIYLEHFKDFKNELNLKQNRTDFLKDSSKKTEFLEIINSYSNKIDDFYSKIFELSSDYEALNITMRKKNFDSIISKLDRNKDQKYPILKVFNDIFGARCIVENYSTLIPQLKQSCDSSYYRFVDKTNNNNVPYKAWHIYIKGENNFIFFIEIQIWEERNAEENKISHKQYKTTYTQAPITYNSRRDNND